MNFKTKLDFCVIPSPYSKGQKNLIFVSYRGANKVDEKLKNDEDYGLLKYTMGKLGYQEIDACTFETASESAAKADILKQKLAEAGLRYSKPFEFNIMGEMNSFHNDVIQQTILTEPPFEEFPISETLPVSVVKKSKIKVPKAGEKVSIYFYLFLQCHFINENDCVLEMIGDLYSNEKNHTRNFLKIMKSDFICLESQIPHTILLKSTKTYGDFFNELDFLHNGSFKFIKPLMNQNGDMIMRTKEFIYNIMEIKKNINPTHKIAMQVNLNQYYEAISMSKKIKKQLTLENKKNISLNVIRPEALLLKQKLKDKMIKLAESDEFEKANLIKTDINFIDNKLKVIDNLEEKNITIQEYFKTFCLSS